MALNIGIISLAYCAGCEVALISTPSFHELLVEGKVKIAYSTLLLDEVELRNVDVLLITGSVRSREDITIIKEAGKKASKTIAFGSCACYGGLPGLANTIKRDELIRSVYGPVEPSTTGSKPEITKFIIPLQAIVKVDYVIPGCPPPEPVIDTLLESLVYSKEFKLPETSVCNECPLNVSDKKPLREIRRRLLALNDIDLNTCFLKQGTLCMGPATRGGCRALCPSKGAPCIGCMGPLPGSRDQAVDTIDSIGGVFYSVEQEERILSAIPDPVGVLSMFTLPYSTIPYHRDVGVKSKR